MSNYKLKKIRNSKLLLVLSIKLIRTFSIDVRNYLPTKALSNAITLSNAIILISSPCLYWLMISKIKMLILMAWKVSNRLQTRTVKKKLSMWNLQVHEQKEYLISKLCSFLTLLRYKKKVKLPRCNRKDR